MRSHSAGSVAAKCFRSLRALDEMPWELTGYLV